MNIRLLPALLLVLCTASLHAQAKRPSSLLPPRISPASAATTAGTPGDWSTFRGPDRDDISKETGLLKQWPAGGPKQVWVFSDAGLGYSGFATSAGTLYTMGANDNGEEFLLALDAAGGKEKWRTVVGARFIKQPWGDGPRSTPTVDGDRVYALGAKGDLLCAGAKDGKKIWSASLTGDYGGQIQGWGFTESVLVRGDHVFCTPGGPKGTILCLDKMTGKKVWQSSDWTDFCQYASIVPATINGVEHLIQLTMKSLAAVNAKDGKLLWQVPFPGATAVIPTPIVKESDVYVAAGYKVGCMMVHVAPDNKTSITYQNTNMVNHHGGVIRVGDHLYGYSDSKPGGWTCQDWKTGDVKWQENKLTKGAIHCADGMLYLLEEKSGTVVLIDASPNGWNEHGRFTLSPQTTQRAPQGKVWTHPVVSHGKLYLRDQEIVYCFDVKA